MNSYEQQADLLYKAVKIAAISPVQVDIGDLIAITGNDTDVYGFVRASHKEGKFICFDMHTKDGMHTIKTSDENFVHIIKKDAMLDLRNHYEYERTEDEKDMFKALEGEHHERPRLSVEESDKSVLPTSKVSRLSLRKKE